MGIIYQAQINGKFTDMTAEQIKDTDLNVLCDKTNGYSHDWQEVEAFNPEKHTNRIIFLTDKPIGRVMGSSVVSFS